MNTENAIPFEDTKENKAPYGIRDEASPVILRNKIKADITDILTAVFTFFSIYFTVFSLYENTVDCRLSIIYFLFSAFTLAVIAKKEGKFRKEAAFPSVMLLSVIVSFSLFSAYDVFRMLICCYLYGYTVCALTGNSAFPMNSIEDVFFQLSSLFFIPIRHVLLPAAVLTEKLKGIRKRANKKSAKVFGIILGIILAIPVFLIVSDLLGNADYAFYYTFSSFSTSLENFIDTVIEWLPLTPDNLIPTILLTPFVFSFIFCSKHSVTREKTDKTREKQTVKKLAVVNTFVFTGFYALISIVYAVFLFSQLSYLFSAFSGILPYGYSLSSYARQGFFEMSAVAVINFGLIMLGELFMKKTEDNKLPKTRKYFSLFLCCFTLLIIIIAGAKMVLYVSTMGLTENRIAVLLADTVLFLTFIVTGIGLFKSRFPYIRIIFYSGVCAVCILLVFSANSFAAVFNTQMYINGSHSKTDVSTTGHADSLITAAVCLDRLTDCDSTETEALAKQQLYTLWVTDKGYAERAKTLDTYLFKAYCEKNEERLQGYKTDGIYQEIYEDTYIETQQNYTKTAILLDLDMPQPVTEIKIENSLFTKTVRNNDGSPLDAGSTIEVYDWCILDGNGEFAVITLVLENGEEISFELRRSGAFVSENTERCLGVGMTDRFRGSFRAKETGEIYLSRKY